MRHYLTAKLLLTILVPLGTAAAATPDSRLIKLISANAQVVAGMSAPSQHGQPDSFVLVTHNNIVDLNDFLSMPGVDNSGNIHQVVMVAAANSAGQLAEHSLLASGYFAQERIFKDAVSHGAVVAEYRGIPVIIMRPMEPGKGIRWFAVIDSDVALFGTIASVQGELDRYVAGSMADATLMRKLSRLRTDDATWCILAVPARSGEIRNALRTLDPALAQLVENGDAFQFGIRYGRQVEFEYEVTAASNSAAQAMSSSLMQSLGGSKLKTISEEASFLPRAGTATEGGGMRGAVKLSRAKFDTWLAQVAQRGRVTMARY